MTENLSCGHHPPYEGRPPRILVLAFACDPYAGSEAGAGWAMVRTAVDVGEVTALISDDHADSVTRWLSEHPEDSDVRFVPVSAPRRSSLIGRMIRVDRRAGFIAYMRWLPAARRVAQSLHEEGPFDVSLHGGYGSYWLPTPLVDLEGVPCVWGPVGGGTRTPRSLWRYLGIRGWIGELQKSLALSIATRMPSVRRTWKRAPIHLFETPETVDVMPKRYRHKARIVNRVLLYELPDFIKTDALIDSGGQKNNPVVLFPSLLEPRKGPMLALHALSYTPEEVRLVFANGGYAAPNLQRTARRLGLEHRVDFLGRIPRAEMLRMARESAAVIFAGLREEGGMGLVEAMLSGTSVVVLSHGGPHVIVKHAVDQERIAAISPSSYRGTAQQIGAAISEFVHNPPPGTGSNLDTESKAEVHRALEDALRIGT